MFDTRPTNPLWGPLSAWLQGANPFDPEDRPETIAQLAEVLGVKPQSLHSIRTSKGFRKFHTDATNAFGEIMLRRAEVLERVYERAMAGDVAAASAYLKNTSTAATLAANGAIDPASLAPADAANLSDEELNQFLSQQ